MNQEKHTKQNTKTRKEKVDLLMQQNKHELYEKEASFSNFSYLFL